MVREDLRHRWEAKPCPCPFPCHAGIIEPNIARYQGCMDLDVARYIVRIHNLRLDNLEDNHE